MKNPSIVFLGASVPPSIVFLMVLLITGSQETAIGWAAYFAQSSVLTFMYWRYFENH